MEAGWRANGRTLEMTLETLRTIDSDSGGNQGDANDYELEDGCR